MSLQRSARFFLLMSILLLSACNSLQDAQKIDPSDVQVGPPISEVESSEVETVHMNNCGGKADALQTAERSKAVSIGGELEIGANYQVVEGAISAKYEQTNSSSKSQTLIAPPGTNMEFVLIWIQNVKTGLINVEGKSGQATYRISTPISVELALSEDLGCQGIVQAPVVPAIPESTRSPQTVPTSESSVSSYSLEDLDALVGDGGWSCISGWPNGISLNSVPAGFVVRSPFVSVDKGSVRYEAGETVPAGGYATGWLQSDLPSGTCSTIQLQISQEDINEILGVGNWSCLANYPNGVSVQNVPSNFSVRSPLVFIDKLDVRYSSGESVPGGGLATGWLQGNLSLSQCP